MPPRFSLLIFTFALLGCERLPTPRRQELKQTVQIKPIPSPSAAPIQPHAGPIFAGSGLPPGVEDAKLIRRVRPIYPAWARKQHLAGDVEFRAMIGKDGRIRELTFIKGPKALVPYVEAAIRQWRYKPMTINGKPVEIPTYLVVEGSRWSQ